MPKLSQTMMKELVDNNSCPRAIYYRFVEGIEIKPTDLMFRGHYFEHHILGSTRDGVEPVFAPLKRGGDPKEKKDLDELIIYARDILDKLGVDIKNGQTQMHVSVEDEEGHLDLVTSDFQNKKRLALYDLKYTETKLDDRWRGWANFEDMWAERFQAAHYIQLWKKGTDEWCPFYFLVFGKDKWVRVIKVELTERGLKAHEIACSHARERLKLYTEQNWPPKRDFNTCALCSYNDICPEVTRVPSVEVFEI